MTVAAIGWVAGIVALQMAPALPGPFVLAALAALAAGLLIGARPGVCPHERLRTGGILVAAVLAGYAWAGSLATLRLAATSNSSG